MKCHAWKFALGLLALAALITTVLLVAQFGARLVAQGPGGGLAPGEVETVLDLPDGNFPEGIALDGRTIYVGNRRIVFVPEDSTFVTSSEILKIAPNGTASLFATFPDTDEFDANGVLGLATDPDGNVYAALDTRKAASKGVWRIRRDGSMVRLAGSERMEFPNALTFDLAGNLYVTDSELGEVWRFEPDGTGGPWAHDVLLEPLPFDPFGFPVPGANGIAFFPPNHLYLANTEHGLILHIPINPDGTPGAVELVAGNPVPADPTLWVPDFRLWTADGVAVDENGDIHVVIAAFAIISEQTGLELSPLVRVDPDSGAVFLTPTVRDAFDLPLSLAFGKLAPDDTSVFVTNGDLFQDPIGPGPGVVKAGVGVRGYSRR